MSDHDGKGKNQNMHGSIIVSSTSYKKGYPSLVVNFYVYWRLSSQSLVTVRHSSADAVTKTYDKRIPRRLPNVITMQWFSYDLVSKGLMLTLSHTTNFRRFQTERSFQRKILNSMKILWKFSSQVKKKLWEKEKLLYTRNFSFSHSVFKRYVLQTRKN